MELEENTSGFSTSSFCNVHSERRVDLQVKDKLDGFSRRRPDEQSAEQTEPVLPVLLRRQRFPCWRVSDLVRPSRQSSCSWQILSAVRCRVLLGPLHSRVLMAIRRAHYLNDVHDIKLDVEGQFDVVLRQDGLLRQVVEAQAAERPGVVAPLFVRNLPPYSFLYYKQLQSLFRLCGQCPVCVIRAYVEFHRTSNDSGVLPEVTLALQMAHKSFKMELQTFPSEQIEFGTGRRSIAHLKFSRYSSVVVRLTADIQSQSLSLMDSVCTKLDPDRLPPNRLFVVNITEVIDVGHFWGFPADEASLGKQRRLTAEINKCTLSPVTVSLYPNLLCLAPYSETNEESLYYRAKILHMRDAACIEVFFLDFGNTAVVFSSSLRELPSDLLAQPFQAHEFQVAGMRPSAQSTILGNKWSSRARDCFVTMVKHQSVIVSLYSILYGVMRVDLLLNKESKSTSVVDILVEEGHAVKAEENVDSRQSHEDLLSMYDDVEKGMYGHSSANRSWRARKKEDEETINILLTQLSSTPKSCSKTNVNLAGPSSSYQTNFYSLSRKTHYRTVSIEKSSINAVTLNENPHFKHQRMIVAGMVAINTSGLLKSSPREPPSCNFQKHPYSNRPGSALNEPGNEPGNEPFIWFRCVGAGSCRMVALEDWTWSVALEKMATEHTRLIYMTTGVLLQKLVLAKSLTEYSHIFVDEVHERSEDMDFLLLVLRKLLHSNSRHVKIILMSATINCREFAEYFATPIWGKMSPAYVYEVEGAPFTIEEFYLDDLQKLYPYRIEPPHADDLLISPKMYDLAISLIQSFNEMEGKDFSKVEEGGTPLSERGSVLVFLPGIHEIRCMQESLAKLANQRLQVYPLHSSVTLEEQNGVFLSPVPWYRKVILSTNIAESSVTVPDVKYVIDFCLARHLVCDKDTNYQSLRLTWASKTNCNQRKGRAGRVSKGFCYRLVTKAFWTNEIPEYMIPEMQLAPLSTILLKVKLLDMGDPRSLLSTALSPPNLSDIVRTVLELIEASKASFKRDSTWYMGALSAKTDGKNQSEDGELTFLGRVLAHLPVDLKLGKMTVLGHVFGCLDDCLIIAASHSLKSFFAIPAMQQLAGLRSKLAFARGTPSDSMAVVNAFRAWYSAKKKGQLRHPKDELSWGKENFIQIKRIREPFALWPEEQCALQCEQAEHFNTKTDSNKRA
ncbi:hypothetical protein CCH79_00004415 [Gambusia affinis]|uniref:RNA helicase n=1 Tax=Gambusia affinis TaxID=33528 RepID=A0A315VBR2_GAMAF|nr:hypothetical protein CCH79_00004415 [Gambusia affinis]